MGSRRDAGTTTGYNDMAPVEKKDSEGKEKKAKKSTYVPTGKPRGRPKGSVSKKNKPYTGKPRGRPKGSTKTGKTCPNTEIQLDCSTDNHSFHVLSTLYFKK